MAASGDTGEEGDEGCLACTIRVTGLFGPLFVCHNASVFLSKFPQMYKRDYSSAYLSIEELEYLSSSFRIEFDNEIDARYRVRLRERHEFSCRVYRHLTEEMGIALRHGGRFGAAFIGYRDINGHGDCLVYFGPLSSMALIAATRVASSVGKEAWIVEKSANCSFDQPLVTRVERGHRSLAQGVDGCCKGESQAFRKKRRLSRTQSA
uniref:Uncharacterized protein TCIL3000_11_10220 n=1 Tax=Trypanosoma congolense (strain IL3000) TaxID=1068625 RepID=G0V1M9_TRYCI|nr:unnamed protein product [Trypanosoma congolense IL3000]